MHFPGITGGTLPFPTNIVTEIIMRILITAMLLLCAVGAQAQNQLLELLREDLRTEKVAIMTASLPLTEEQSTKFWPIYRDYGNELSKIGDRRLATIKTIVNRYENMDDETAEKLVKESFSMAEDRNDLLEKYYKKVAEAVGVVPAARFLQIEGQLLTLIDAKVIDEVPLVKIPAKKAVEEKK
jgi:Spy/CpxP family protein refolding chaperone